MIEFKTLKQNMEGDISREDIELTAAVNEGWGIINITILDRNDDYPMLRVVTLKRETPVAVSSPTLPDAIIQAHRVCVLRRKQASGLTYEADDALVYLLGQMIPQPEFTTEELDS